MTIKKIMDIEYVSNNNPMWCKAIKRIFGYAKQILCV